MLMIIIENNFYFCVLWSGKIHQFVSFSFSIILI